MFQLKADQLQNVLLIGAHADDIEIGCGGTIIRLLNDHPGLKVTWVVLAATEERRLEAINSANSFLGTNHSVRVESFPDRFFPTAFESLKRYFDELGTQLSGASSPDIVFTHRLDDRHQDHRITAELTWNTFRDHLILEYEIPKYEGDLGQPNIFVPLAESTARQKAELIWDSFPSQQGRYWFRHETFMSLMRIRGLEAGRHSTFAEGFYGKKLLF